MITWTKRDEQGRMFAEVHGRAIGYVRKACASRYPEFDWELVVLGVNVGVDQHGSCKTERYAKKALVRNWNKFCERFNLVSRNLNALRGFASKPFAPTPVATENHDNVVTFAKPWKTKA